MPHLRCLEFFSGIGGFHYALKESVDDFEIVSALEINDTLNSVYALNFPNTHIHQCNIEALKSEYYDKIGADLWTLSPPCQPFTRKGMQRDVEDSRCDALKSICSALERMKNLPQYICLENVCGFETSNAHLMLFNILTQLSYHIEEFILTPLDFLIPNSRPRYYLLAKHKPHCDVTTSTPKLLQYELPNSDGSISTINQPMHCIGDYVDEANDNDEGLKVNKHTVDRYLWCIDMVSKKSKTSTCFTKSYSSFISGTGPLLVCAPDYQVETVKSEEFSQKISNMECADEQRIEFIEALQLRYLSWREIANLMGFPSTFSKPQNVTQKQMYRALGNSINIKVVSALLRYLLLQ